MICILAMLLASLTIHPVTATAHKRGDQQPGQQTRLQQDEERFQRQIEIKRRGDEKLRELSQGVMEMKKFSYKSRADGMEIPAYIFQPLKLRGTAGHPALVWIHENLHGDLYPYYFTFIKEAVERGYVVICPEYRGSTGYGREHYEAIDYGGYEVDDCLTAVDYLKANVPHVDPQRIGVIGWSHGGYITLFCLIRDQQSFKAGAAIVPVTNLVFRLSYKGPGYTSNFTSQKRIGGAPHEKRDLYIERSPVYHVDKIQTPVLVHLADNDTDVNFVEAEMLAHALRAKKPDLAEVKIYHNPPGEHNFNRQVDRQTYQRIFTKAQQDSWNRIWTFFEWNLDPWRGAEVGKGK
jgi:dipeptidyl aminopeptidase/acylaminoacyl peptidase